MTHAHSTTFPYDLTVIQSVIFWYNFSRSSYEHEASPTTLHAVPNHHSLIFPIFNILWSPLTIQNTLLKLLQLNICWEGSITQVRSNTYKPLFGLIKAFHMGGSTLRKLSHPSESSTTRVKYKNPFFETHSHTTLRDCVRERVSRGHL